MNTCAPDPTISQVRERWDRRNRPSIFRLESRHYEDLAKSSALKGVLDQKPWRDDFWPFYKTGLANRYQLNESFESFEEQRVDGLHNAKDPRISPAEKYDLLVGDGTFSLTRESWDLYEHYASKYGGDAASWRWMGTCSGWSPASFLEPPTRSHVVARAGDGPEILFYEGDIRSLISKVYDINRSEGGIRILGQRCNMDEADVVRDGGGRPVDGIVGEHEAFYIIDDSGFSSGVLEVSAEPQRGDVYWLLADQPVTSIDKSYRTYRYDSYQDLIGDLEAGQPGGRSRSRVPESVRFLKNCRDVNAASFHLALVDMISSASSKRRGFVFETSRYWQVWNSPVWGFVSRFSEIRRSATEPPAQLFFHAPETAFLVDVETDVIYIKLDPPAKTEYDDPEDLQLNLDDLDGRSPHYGVIRLQYSLEFDGDGFLVGGEWQEDEVTQQYVPDFIWRPYGNRTDELRSGGQSPVKYTVVKQLLDCSRRQPDRAVTWDGQSIDVVDCQVEGP